MRVSRPTSCKGCQATSCRPRAVRSFLRPLLPSLATETERRQRPSSTCALQADRLVEPRAGAGDEELADDKLEDCSAFTALGVHKGIAAALPKQGIHTASEIQQIAIPKIIEGQSVAIRSFTGSGKTLAFVLPLLTQAITHLEKEVRGRRARNAEQGPVVVVVAPSRELAMQIVRVAQGLLPGGSTPMVQQLIGGANRGRQVEQLRQNGPLVVVGTPGRLAELSRSGQLRTHSTAMLVLDEADQLLCQQFRDDMFRLLTHVGKRLKVGAQVVCASATISQGLARQVSSMVPSAPTLEVLSLANDEVPVWNPTGSGSEVVFQGWGGAFAGGKQRIAGSAGGVRAQADRGSLSPGVQHVVVHENRRHHVDCVRRLIHAVGAKRTIIFMNFQGRLQDAMFKLNHRGLSAGVLNGEMSKQRRGATLEAFRTGRCNVLLVSDVVARGLDVPECEMVVNLEMPSNAAHYVHRAGRTGRMGRAGLVANIIEEQSQFVVDKISRQLGVTIRKGRVTGGELCVTEAGAVEVIRSRGHTEN